MTTSSSYSSSMGNKQQIDDSDNIPDVDYCSKIHCSTKDKEESLLASNNNKNKNEFEFMDFTQTTR